MKVVSIVVTFNPDLTLLIKQLRSIHNFSKIVLVDNFSKNVNEIDYLCKEISVDILLIKLNDNFGLGYAQNKGIEEAVKFTATHVLLFDQDSFLSEESFRKLVELENELVSNGIKVGAVGPVCIDPLSEEIYPITQYYGPFIIRKYLNKSEISEASFIVASGSFIQLSVIQDIGMMRDELFIDYIDVEWCYRAQAKGYKLFVTSDSTLEHIIGDARVMFLGRSISMHSAVRRYYLTRNCFKILSLSFIPLGYKIRESSLLIVRVIAFMYLSTERVRYLKLIFRAFSDAVQGKYGKLQEKIK